MPTGDVGRTASLLHPTKAMSVSEILAIPPPPPHFHSDCLNHSQKNTELKLPSFAFLF
jgi:hypothetical protein